MTHTSVLMLGLSSGVQTLTPHTLRMAGRKRVIDGHGDGLALQLRPISSVKISCCGHISSPRSFPNAL